MTGPEEVDNADVVRVLNGLIGTCKDGEKGFRAASEGVADTELATLFLNYSDQRAGFAAELLTEVRRLGGDPETGDEAPGAGHRGWTGIQEAVAGKQEVLIIAEAQRSEDHAAGAYSEALKRNLPTAVQAIVENHYVHVRDACGHVRALERAHHEKSSAAGAIEP